MRGRRSCSFPEGVHREEGVYREEGVQREVEGVHPNKCTSAPSPPRSTLFALQRSAAAAAPLLSPPSPLPPLTHPHPLLHPGTACCMSLGPMCWVDLAPCWDSLMSSTRGKTGERHLLLVDRAFYSASIQWRDLPPKEGSDPPPHSCGWESEVSVHLPHQEALSSRRQRSAATAAPHLSPPSPLSTLPSPTPHTHNPCCNQTQLVA